MPTARTLIVVPAWNEADAVGDTVTEIRSCLPDAVVLVVDDGSTDDTAACARDAGARLLQLPFNLGVGGAMRAGFRYAQEHGFTQVVQVDADGQHDPRTVAALLAGLADHDLVIGARFAGEGDYRVATLRRAAMRMLAASVSRLAHTPLSDTTSGLRASGPRALELFAHHYPVEYLGDTVESTIIAARAGLRIGQVPVAMRARRGGVASQPPWKAAMYLLRAALVLVLATLRRRDLGGRSMS